MAEVSIWGHRVPSEWLSEECRAYLQQVPTALPPIEWLWGEMDKVWDSLGLDNTRSLQGQPIAEFYSHPVWTVNGFFSAADPMSHAHREAIATALAQRNAHHVVDFGGGFGELAIAISAANPSAQVEVVDPFPSRTGIERLRAHGRIRLVSSLPASGCDAVIAQDVLEHLEDPIALAFEMAGAVGEDGVVLFANCFMPFIKCHLPGTFHLRHTFPWVMRRMGLDFIGVVPGAPHAQLYVRTRALDLGKARTAERISRWVGPVLNFASGIYARLKQAVSGHSGAQD